MNEVEGNSHVIAEYYEAKIALQFIDPLNPKLKIGEYIRMSGSATAEVFLKDGYEAYKGEEYKHNPLDGSPNTEWNYFHSVTLDKIDRIGPLAIMQSARLASARLDAIVQDWIPNSDVKNLIEVINTIDDARALLSQLLREKRAVQVDRHITSAKISDPTNA
ncbi:MAG TPA: hypothetical protein VIE65_04270 [Methylobacter sp.]